MNELKRYEDMLKRNKETIKRLTDQNKHIEAHIKFLKSMEPEAEVVGTTFTVAPLTTKRIDE